MKSAGVLTSQARARHALGASLAAMLLIVFATSIAAAQSGADTEASKTWKTAAAAAAPGAASSAAVAPAAAVPVVAAPAVAGAAIAEAAPPAPPRAAVATSVDPAPADRPPNMVPTPLDNVEANTPGTAEIPTANSADASPPQPPGSSSGTLLDSQPPQEPQTSSEVARYEEEQSGMPPEQLRSLQQFDSEGELSTPFGMQLREAKRTLKSGEEADGLLITAVEKGSPAASVGLKPYNHTVHDALAAAAMVGAVFSGGLAVIVIPAIDYMQVGETYDMIIGVDGSRVTNFLDFQDRMRDLQPGELVYLSVVRNGKRMQFAVPVPTNIQQATN